MVDFFNVGADVCDILQDILNDLVWAKSGQIIWSDRIDIIGSSWHLQMIKETNKYTNSL